MSQTKPPAKLDAYAALIADVKARIQHAQTLAVLAVNAELVRLYWDIGRVIAGRQADEGWGRPSSHGWPWNSRTSCRN